MFLHLIFSNFRFHKVRVALTIAAVALSVSLVVATTSGYTSIQSASFLFFSQFISESDAQVIRQNSTQGGVDSQWIPELRNDPSVAKAVGRLEVSVPLLDQNGKPLPYPLIRAIGIQGPSDTLIGSKPIERGQWFGKSSANIAVLDQAIAEQLHLDIGDTFIMPGLRRPTRMMVVGILRKSSSSLPQRQAIYLPLTTLQNLALPNQADQLSHILIKLKPDTDPEAFRRRWQPILTAKDPLLKLNLPSSSKDAIDKNLQSLQLFSYLGSAASILAASFIVFSSLSTGVVERQRVLGMLRAIGAFRWQVGGLVIFEGLLLSSAGAILGIPLGWGWIKLISLVPNFESFFLAGVTLNRTGILFGMTTSILAAAVASFLPAFSAMRVSPMEAMTPLAALPACRPFPWRPVLLGLLLITIDPIILCTPFSTTPFRSIQFHAHFIFGLPALMVGFFFLAPLFIYLADWFLCPILAALFDLRLTLLRQQLTTGLWRTVGTCTALMVGLAILILFQVQGRSSINNWKIPDKFPDTFIVSYMGGLAPQDIKRIQSLPGIQEDETMPLVICSPELGNGIFAIAGSALLPDATLFVGINPDLMQRMMELDFVIGNSSDAIRLLRSGRHILVSEEFYRLKRLSVGDKFPLKTIHGTVEYTIAGVVSSPGLEIINRQLDVGTRIEQRTAGSVFGTIEDARDDFGADRVTILAVNLADRPSSTKDQTANLIQTALTPLGMKLFNLHKLKAEVQATVANMLLFISTIAFAAMVIAAMGVTNTIMASIRIRRWEFGILRSIGMTRWHLLRIILAESIMLGSVASLLGLLAGFEMVFTNRILALYLLGRYPVLSIPWPFIFIGVLILMLISLLATFWPAFRLARTPPLTLLRATRAAM